MESGSGHLTNNHPRLVWQGLTSITNCKGSSTNNAKALLVEELNNFFVQFKVTHLAAITTDLQSLHTHAPGIPSEAGVEGCVHQKKRWTGW